MDVWKSRSNSGSQTALAVGCIVVGLVLAIACRDFGGPGMTNSLAGFLLGLLLLLIGIAAFVTKGTQTVVIDPAKRLITIEDTSRFGAKTRSIPFNHIVKVGVGYLGKKSNFVTFYYLVLHLRTGEEYSLFSPGRFYEGASDRSVVESWRVRLEKYLHHS